ncbi:Gfo/Idh/MocA family protein [Citricoccus muralis]|uniref:Gfo/Idh/MocA family oxidoreductase n=1 Tax=Citricoccus muralis TaxID=169134 RepID=A0ABY8H8C9_9MICC|nr:Gfo/Idh/MocA family oxidoreductase [Citricoccus muralis]WFP17084.1 Gfo/Idh/MocA family oxidoreductase [Citricoccus muralis]
MSTTSPSPLRVALIGHAFMGRVHSHAWRTAPRFFELPVAPELTVLVGRDAERSAAAARQLGWAESATDWRQVIARDDIDVVDICTPGDSHADIAEAALRAGKHVLVEKPMANTVAEAERMAVAAREAAGRGVRAMVGFTYRRTPALQLAQKLIRTGRIGTVRQVRAQYLQDWLSDSTSPLTWRLDKNRAGSGALGDIGAHLIDMTCFLTGEQFAGVSGALQTFVPQRPVAEAPGSPLGPVTVDDAVQAMGTLTGGAPVVLEASRAAWGRKNALRIEVTGSTGAIAFDFEDMNVLQVFDPNAQTEEITGFTRVQVTEPTHPYLNAWWPPGHGLGYEHGFTHQVVDFVESIHSGTQPTPSFDDGLHVQRVLDAVQRSAAEASRYTPITTSSQEQ